MSRTALVLAVWCTAVEARPPVKPSTAPVSMVGMVAKTHAVRRPTVGGFGDTLEFLFVRFLERDRTNRELTIRYRCDWETARPDHFVEGRALVGQQTVTFPTPSPADRERTYQTSVIRLQLAHRAEPADGGDLLRGQHFRVCLTPPDDGAYEVVSDDGRLISELNRRWAEHTAVCRIYEGCVMACLPNDQATSAEHHPFDALDVDQFVPDCYLAAALVAAVRRDPDQIKSLITESAQGYEVTFPGQPRIAVPTDLDRGPDMFESRALDVDARGNVELWPLVVERAYAVLNARSKATNAGPGQEFQDLPNGDAQCTYYLLTGRHVAECTRWKSRSRPAQLQAIADHLQSARPVMLSTGKWTHPGGQPQWWLEDHVYVLHSIGPAGKTLSVIDPCCGQLVERIKLGDWFDSSEVKRFLLCE